MLMVPGKFDRKITMQALRTLRDEVGGKIKGQKLYPLADYFADLIVPDDPVLSLNRRAYLLQTAPQQEVAVADALLKAGLDVYLPKEPKSVRLNAVKRRTVSRPMLPGYVFPIFDEHRDQWQTLPEMRGVVRLFMIHERPVPIGEAAIQHIKAREIEANIKGRPVKAPAWIKVGVWVQFTEMPWQGLVGQVEAMLAAGERIKVAVDVFGRQTPVEVSANQVRAV